MILPGCSLEIELGTLNRRLNLNRSTELVKSDQTWKGM